jgi:hypothetical protein
MGSTVTCFSKRDVINLSSRFCYTDVTSALSQWPRCLKHEMSSLARTLGLCARTPFKAWMSLCVYSVFVLGSDLATG